MRKFKNNLFLFLLMATVLACKTKKETIPFSPGAVERYKTPEEEKKVNKSLIYDAKKAEILGDLNKAEELFKKVLEKNPNNDVAYYELANIYYRYLDYEDALIYAEKAASIDPGNIWYQQLLADLFQKNSQYDNATKVFASLVKTDPENFDYRYQLAIAYIYSGEYHHAIEEYNLIEEMIGITEEVSIQKQKLYIQLKKVDKAAEEIKQLIKAQPNENKYYAILAEIYMSQNEPEKALEIYKTIADNFPNDPYIHISLSDYYRKIGDKEKSFEELKLGFKNPRLEIDSKIQILLSYYTVSEIYEELKDQAITLAAILIESHPADPKSHSMYADFLVRDGRYEEARDEFRKVLELDSSRFLIWESLLRIEAEIGDFEAMLEESILAMELYPEQPLVYLFNGVANYQLKKYDEGVKSFNNGVSLVIDNNLLKSQFYAYLGDVYNQLHDDAASDAAYEMVLVLDPDNSYVLNNFAYYLSLRKEKLKKAAIMAQKACRLDPENSANLDTYGWVLFQLEQYNEAAVWIKKALKQGGSSSAVILEHYGDVLFKQGEAEEANLYWEKAKAAGEGSEFLDKKVQDRNYYE